jgi:hypothetical protein
VSKTAAVVLAFLSFLLLTAASRAQLLPSGNVYVGVAYGDSVDVVNRSTAKGWNASVEDLPFARFSHLGVVLDGSGLYWTGVQQYNLVLGPRLSINYGKWRPFIHVMGGAQRNTSNGFTHYPIAVDVGGGADYKLPFKHFSWRLQFDYVHTHLLSANQNEYRGSTGLVWRF